ncbi:uncharacterized protein LOC129733218 [Wyeomyia smithii]|uniref:uncharacterized protein LOC129733218 n=1 Tax=Wyeomyia smithii TaxID=174621 RepID=UPI002468125B|nr:uncharacterized protein LOC129733218 [Wyeomyia smithii]
MKAVLVCLLFALAGQSLAQTQEEFLDYLMEIQAQAEAVHQIMEGTFDNTRFAMSDHLIGLNRDLIASMNDALIRVEEIRETTEELVSNSNAPQNCIDVATANWDVEITWVGQAIQQCAIQANLEITGATANMHGAIENAQTQSTELQNIVVHGFIDWNAIDYTESISTIVGARIEQRQQEFETVTEPNLERVLGEVFALTTDMLPRITTCINRGVERFNNYARVISDTLFFCQ